MLEFLHTIFQINNFDIEEIEHNELISKFAYPNKENKNQEFYLILDYSSKTIDFSGDNINETLEELMDKIDRSIYSDESTKKNTTLILCVNELDITVQDLLRIEENPYYFKKNVITYNDKNIIDLKRNLQGDYSNNSINKLLTTEGGIYFEEFKKSSQNNYYSLLIKIITKLPFVHYIPQTNNLQSLEDFVSIELNEYDNKLLSYICNSNIEDDEHFIQNVILSDWDNL